MNDREQFEAWFEADCMPSESDWFRKDSDGDYDYPPTYWAHRGYQACAESMRGEERERIADHFEGQRTDSCPGTNISKEIRSLK